MNLEQIDTSTTAGKAEVMRLAAEGRRVFATRRKDGGGAGPVEPEWNWQDWDYAIIAEPVGPEEVWAAFHENGGIAAVYTSSPMAYQGIGVARYIRADLAGGDA